MKANLLKHCLWFNPWGLFQKKEEEHIFGLYCVTHLGRRTNSIKNPFLKIVAKVGGYTLDFFIALAINLPDLLQKKKEPPKTFAYLKALAFGLVLFGVTIYLIKQYCFFPFITRHHLPPAPPVVQPIVKTPPIPTQVPSFFPRMIYSFIERSIDERYFIADHMARCIGFFICFRWILLHLPPGEQNLRGLAHHLLITFGLEKSKEEKARELKEQESKKEQKSGEIIQKTQPPTESGGHDTAIPKTN